MVNEVVSMSTRVTWSFELHKDLKSVKEARDENQDSHLVTRTEVTGYLTPNSLGLIINPSKKPIEGYYVDYVTGLFDPEYLEDELYADLKYLGGLLALFYVSEDEKGRISKMDVVGVFNDDTWKESYGKFTTPATFRFPSPLLEDYKKVCHADDVSQADALIKVMWEYVRDYRLDTLCGDDFRILLGNGNYVDFTNEGQNLLNCLEDQFIEKYMGDE